MMCFILLLFHLSVMHSMSLPRYRELREHKELIVDVSENVKQRFVINRADVNHPVYLAITPCGGNVHWRLYSIDRDGLVNLDNSDSPAFELIAGEADNRRMKFFSNHIKSETLLLVLSVTSSSSARVFLTSSESAMNEQYPALPHDTRLAYAVEKGEGETRQAMVNWKVADVVRSDQSSRYRICAIVSRRYPNWAICDLLDEGLESIHCVPNRNNSMIVGNLRSGRKYFITVFVRDSHHGTTSSYETLEVNLKKARELVLREPKQDEVRLLPDSSLQTAVLPPKKASSLSYYYAVPAQNSTRSEQRVLMIVHSCEGSVSMNIYRNGRILKKTEPFSGYRRFLVVNVRSGQLRFEVVNEDKNAKSVRLWASTRPEKSPYPMLPEDTSVKIVRRSCDSATLQWLRAGDAKAEYCIYKRKENAHYLEHIVSRADNLCTGGISSELVGCYQHKGPLNTDITDPVGIIETTIGGLEPNSTYRFDLLATPLRRRGSQALPYRTVWVRTVDC